MPVAVVHAPSAAATGGACRSEALRSPAIPIPIIAGLDARRPLDLRLKETIATPSMRSAALRKMSGLDGVPVNESEVAVVWAPSTAAGASLVGAVAAAVVAAVGAVVGGAVVGGTVVGGTVVGGTVVGGTTGDSVANTGAKAERPRASTPWVVARRH